MFKKAERKQAKLRLALCGPSGSGKTYSALLIAQGLSPGGRIALLDTERGSGELYADLLNYDVAPLMPPYTPDRYIALIREAAKAGYDVLIIDSLSHAWTGEGGVLDMHEKATTAAKGNSWAAWREVTPLHNALVDAMLGANLHIIATMRTKTAYEITDSDGKKKPVKVGLAPVQRDGMEYEFTAVLDLTTDAHIATASKDRTSLFDGKHFTPAPETGEALREWLETGRNPKEERARIDQIDNAPHRMADPPIGAGSPAHRALEARINELDLNREGVKIYVKRQFGVDHFPELTAQQQRELILSLPGLAVKKLLKQITLMTAPDLDTLIQTPPAWLAGMDVDLAKIMDAADRRLIEIESNDGASAAEPVAGEPLADAI